MRDYVTISKRLRRYSENCVAYKLDADFANAVTDAADAIEGLLENDHRQTLLLRYRAEKIKELESAVPKWISVEERLPSRYETVLLNIQTCKDSYVTIGDYEPNELRFRDFADRNNQVYCGDIVTHWVPLPEPPKEVQDNA